jgi:hypothetical protein
MFDLFGHEDILFHILPCQVLPEGMFCCRSAILILQRKKKIAPSILLETFKQVYDNRFVR